jgi:hypothetical protein
VKQHLALILFIVLNSCKSEVSTFIPFVEGYWEIVSVTKNQKDVKTYKMNGTIDYFKVNSDLSGYRKKVVPRVDGAFEMSQHKSEFTLSIVGDDLWITYTNNDVTYREEITRANNSSLILSNSDGFVYTYKPYEPLIFE